MSYRDDHAAALARAEALEAELARTVAERDRLRVELARSRAQRFPLPVPMSMYVRPGRTSGVVLALRIGVLVALIGVGVLAMTAVHPPARATHVEVVPIGGHFLPPPPVSFDMVTRCAEAAAHIDASAPCRFELVQWVHDPRLVSLHATLLDWLVLEQALPDVADGERDAVLARRGQLLARLHPD